MKRALVLTATASLLGLLGYSCNDSGRTEANGDVVIESPATSANAVRKKPDGQQLFVENCAACHQKDRDAIGPALHGVVTRWEGDTARLRRYIRNNVEMTQDGDLHAEALQEHWNGNMPLFLDFTDEDIDAILSYVESK